MSYLKEYTRKNSKLREYTSSHGDWSPREHRGGLFADIGNIHTHSGYTHKGAKAEIMGSCISPKEAVIIYNDFYSDSNVFPKRAEKYVCRLLDFTSALEDEFNRLAQKWEEETTGFSTSLQKSVNQNYLQIIALEDKRTVISLILKQLQKKPDHWFIALKVLSNSNPVPPEDMGNIRKMRQHWLMWGHENRLI